MYAPEKDSPFAITQPSDLLKRHLAVLWFYVGKARLMLQWNNTGVESMMGGCELSSEPTKTPVTCHETLVLVGTVAFNPIANTLFRFKSCWLTKP